MAIFTFLPSSFFVLFQGYDPPAGVKITPLLKAALSDLKPKVNATEDKVSRPLSLDGHVESRGNKKLCFRTALLEVLRVTFTANGKREIRVYVFLKK